MTTPEERTQAVMQTKRFLERLCSNGSTSYEVPEEIRRTARRLLKHYPGGAHLDQAAVAWPGSWAGERRGQTPSQEHAPSYLELLARLRAFGEPASVGEGTGGSEWQTGTVIRLSRGAGFGYVRDSARGCAYIFSVTRVLKVSQAHLLCVDRQVRFRVNLIGHVDELELVQDNVRAGDAHA